MGDPRVVQLRDVLTPVKRPVQLQAATAYRTLGVRWYGNGSFTKPAKRGDQIASKTLNEVRAGDVVYSKLFAWKGSFAVVAPESDGAAASTEFPTYIADQQHLLPEYFALWASQPEVWGAAEDASTGTTTGSRNRLNPEDFLDFEIELPSVDEQLAAVAVVGKFDALAAALDYEAALLKAAHRAARVELIEDLDADREELGELVHGVRGGKSPKCLDRSPLPNEFGVLKVSAIRDGLFRPEEAKALPSGLAPWNAIVRAGDLIYSRANTTALVGAVCRVPRDYPQLLLCDKTIRIDLDEARVDPDYFVEAIGIPSARDHIEHLAGGTSDSMKNISQDAFLETEIPVPDLQLQADVAHRLKSLSAANRRVIEEATKLRSLRRAFLGEWFAGSVAPNWEA